MITVVLCVDPSILLPDRKGEGFIISPEGRYEFPDLHGMYQAVPQVRSVCNLYEPIITIRSVLDDRPGVDQRFIQEICIHVILYHQRFSIEKPLEFAGQILRILRDPQSAVIAVRSRDFPGPVVYQDMLHPKERRKLP